MTDQVWGVLSLTHRAFRLGWHITSKIVRKSFRFLCKNFPYNVDTCINVVKKGIFYTASVYHHCREKIYAGSERFFVQFCISPRCWPRQAMKPVQFRWRSHVSFPLSQAWGRWPESLFLSPRCCPRSRCAPKTHWMTDKTHPRSFGKNVLF